MFKLSVMVSLSLLAACGVEQPDLEPQAEASANLQPPPPCASTNSAGITIVDHYHKLMPGAGGTQFGSGVFQTLSGVGPTGNWLPKESGDALIVTLPVSNGETIVSVDVNLVGDPQTTLGASVMKTTTAFAVGQVMGTALDVSTKTTQTISVPVNDTVDTSVTAYWLKLTAQRADGASSDNQTIVGPAVVHTTTMSFSGTSSPPSC